MKKIFVVLVFLLLVSSCEAKEDDSNQDVDIDKPITATTVEECIEEIQCAWDYFKNIAFGSDLGTEGVEKENINKIRKFDKDTFIVVAHTGGDNEFYFDVFSPLVKKTFPMIKAFTKLNTQINNPTNPAFNILILIDENDPDDGISEKTKKAIRNLTDAPEGWFEEQFIDIRKHGKTDTFAIIGVKKGGYKINASLIFTIKYKHPNTFKAALVEEIVQSTGLTNDYKGKPFTKFNELVDKIWPTNLDWLLLAILYHDSVKMGMTPEQVKEIFSVAYKDSKTLLKNYLKASEEK